MLLRLTGGTGFNNGESMRAHTSLTRFWGIAAWAVAALLLSGCTGAMSGVSGTALVRTGYPRLTAAANAPLVLQGYGRQWVSLPSDYMGILPSGAMDYTVYSEGAEGPVTRHAHVFAVQPSDEKRWYFKPDSLLPFDGLSFGRKDINGYRWAAQILRVHAGNDWFSAMWRDSGRGVPELWLARRFSATPDRSTRVVAEYREPWPECLDPEVKDLVFARQGCLEGFLERSDAAFSLDMHAPETLEAPAVPSLLPKPDFAPNMKKLAGELAQEDLFPRGRW